MRRMCCRSGDLNREWNKRISSQRMLTDHTHGDIVHQTYALPWPLKTRELLMKCSNTISRPYMTSRCQSVQSDMVPVSADATRMEILASVSRRQHLGTRQPVYHPHQFAHHPRVCTPPSPVCTPPSPFAHHPRQFVHHLRQPSPLRCARDFDRRNGSSRHCPMNARGSAWS